MINSYNSAILFGALEFQTIISHFVQIHDWNTNGLAPDNISFDIFREFYAEYLREIHGKSAENPLIKKQISFGFAVSSIVCSSYCTGNAFSSWMIKKAKKCVFRHSAIIINFLSIQNKLKYLHYTKLHKR